MNKLGRASALACLVGLALLAAGCATVQPFQREHLADRIMDPAATARERAVEQHWLDTREGAAGGALSAGGGCACN
jgi:hypothetical protein